jgi:hypothetical protein
MVSVTGRTVVVSVFQTGAAVFHSSSSSMIIKRLCESRSKPTASQQIWYSREPNPGPLDLYTGTLNTRPQRWSYFHEIRFNIS